MLKRTLLLSSFLAIGAPACTEGPYFDSQDFAAHGDQLDPKPLLKGTAFAPIFFGGFPEQVGSYAVELRLGKLQVVYSGDVPRGDQAQPRFENLQFVAEATKTSHPFGGVTYSAENADGVQVSITDNTGVVFALGSARDAAIVAERARVREADARGRRGDREATAEERQEERARQIREFRALREDTLRRVADAEADRARDARDGRRDAERSRNRDRARNDRARDEERATDRSRRTEADARGSRRTVVAVEEGEPLILRGVSPVPAGVPGGIAPIPRPFPSQVSIQVGDANKVGLFPTFLNGKIDQDFIRLDEQPAHFLVVTLKDGLIDTGIEDALRPFDVLDVFAVDSTRPSPFELEPLGVPGGPILGLPGEPVEGGRRVAGLPEGEPIITLPVVPQGKRFFVTVGAKEGITTQDVINTLKQSVEIASVEPSITLEPIPFPEPVPFGRGVLESGRRDRADDRRDSERRDRADDRRDSERREATEGRRDSERREATEGRRDSERRDR